MDKAIAQEQIEPVVRLQLEGAVATVTMTRPKALNALDQQMVVELRDVFHRLDQMDDCRCVVLTGADGNFMAGGDIRMFADRLRESPEGREAMFRGEFSLVNDIIMTLKKMKKPVVAVVEGAAAGFGVSLALACDLVVARDDAYFSLAYCHLGVSPDGGATWQLPRLVGMKRAMEIALLGEKISAKDAAQIGMINRAVPEAAFVPTVQALVGHLANGPTQSYAKTKALMLSSMQHDLGEQLQLEAEAFVQSTSNQDFAEGVQAFLEKRRPDFKGQ